MSYLIAIIAGIAGFLFGYDEGIISGSLQTLVKQFSMTNQVIGFITSALPIGAIFGSMVIGSLLASKFLKNFGRRKLLIIIGVLYTIGGLGVSVSPNTDDIALSRLILGVAIGIGAIITPLYISETAPTNIRGRLVTIYQLAITAGILFSYLINYLLVNTVSWRLIYVTVVIPALLLLSGAIFLPESPRWLVLTGQYEKAKTTLCRLRKGFTQININTELQAIMEAIHTEKKSGWRDLVSPLHRPSLMIGVCLFILQQISGINAVIYYAPTIFYQAGFSGISAQNLATLVIGSINFLATILSMLLVEKLGRFYLLIIGFIGTAISLSLIFFAGFMAIPHENWLALIALSIYMVSFAIGLGPIPYLMMSEIFPLNIRGSGMSLASVSNWVFNAIIVFIFPLLSANLGISNTFGLFALACFFGLIFTLRYVPETKGISLEAIEIYINSGKPLRKLGRR